MGIKTEDAFAPEELVKPISTEEAFGEEELGIKSAAREPVSFWEALGAGLRVISREAAQQHPIISGLTTTGRIAQEAFATPAAFLNMFLSNLPRAVLAKKGIDYPMAATLLGKAGYYAGGAAGAVTSPLTKLGLTPSANIFQAVAKGAGAGALTGAAWTPTPETPEENFTWKKRAAAAGIGAITGIVIPIAGRLFSNLKTGIQNIRKEPQVALKASEETFIGADKIRKAVQEEYSIFRDATKDTKIDIDELQKTVTTMFPKPRKIAIGEIPKPPETQLIMPDKLKQELNEIFLEKEVNLGTIYKTKDAISRHIKPGTWTDIQLRKQITPEQEHLVKAYFSLDKFVDDSLTAAGMNEEKALLDYLNKKATDLYGMTRKLRKMVYDSTLKTPTKTSKLVSIFTGDIAKEAGDRLLFQRASELEPLLGDVIGKMDILNKVRQTKSLLKWGGITAGVAIGGKLTGEAIERMPK